MEEGTSLQYIFNFFREKKNRKNAFGAEFDSAPNAFFRFSIPVTQSKRGFFFKIIFLEVTLRCPVQYAI